MLRLLKQFLIQILLLTEQGSGDTGNTTHLRLPRQWLFNCWTCWDLTFTKWFLQSLRKILTRYLCQRCLLWTIWYIFHTAAPPLPTGDHSLHPRSPPEYPSPLKYPQHLPVSTEPWENQVSWPDCIFDSLKNQPYFALQTSKTNTY